MRNVARVSVLGLALAGLSCGSDDDADSASGFAAAYCDLIQPCCAMAKLKTDGQQCRFFFALAGGQARYDKQAGEACLAETRAAMGRADFCGGLDGGEPSACDGVFEQPGGSKQPGETCSDDGDCAKSSEGEVECKSNFGLGQPEVRKCQVVIRGKDGDKPCVGTQEAGFTSGNTGLDDVPARGFLCRVADGLRCDATSDTCVKLKPAGEVCGAGGSDECVRTAYCDDAMDRCLERKAVGAPCTPGFASDECAAGAWCGQTTRMCAAQLADGEACTESDACRSGNCMNGKCERSPFGDLGLTLICGAP